MARAPAAQPAPVAMSDSDLTFAKGYAQRRARQHLPLGRRVVAHAAQTKLGRPALKMRKVVARKIDRRRDTARAEAARANAYNMFGSYPGNQFHARPVARYGNSPNGFFGGLF